MLQQGLRWAHVTQMHEYPVITLVNCKRILDPGSYQRHRLWWPPLVSQLWSFISHIGFNLNQVLSCRPVSPRYSNSCAVQQPLCQALLPPRSSSKGPGLTPIIDYTALGHMPFSKLIPSHGGRER